MKLTKVSLTNFRSYKQLDLSLTPGMTVLVGDNGQGKSNLLEAIYLLAIGKSYRATNDRDLVSWEEWGRQGYTIVAGTVDYAGGMAELRIGLEYGTAHVVGKRVRVNGVPKRASDLIGILNAVLFSAEDIDLVFGPPAGRRRYLDILLSQVSRRYVKTLQRYQRVLSQRNALLKAIREGRAKEDGLAFWDDSLAAESASILTERWSSIASLAPLLNEAFQRLSGSGSLTAEYVSTIDRPPGGDYKAATLSALMSARSKERASGVTMVGPHRDDVKIVLSGVEISRHASRGQARLAALALRLAEARFLAEKRDDAPLLLLDDALSELDEKRRGLVIRESHGYSQVIITSADAAALPGAELINAHRLGIKDYQISTQTSD